jgi:hypothetical protein
MKRVNANEVVSVKIPAQDIEDRVKVRIGSMSPSFPVGQSRPTNFADAGKVRMGSMSPGFPPGRAA